MPAVSRAAIRLGSRGCEDITSARRIQKLFSVSAWEAYSFTSTWA